MTREQKIGLVVALLTLAAILFVSVFRNGTSW
jgi:hypothetical protein